MQITAICPSCQSRYQLNADLLGQKIRCPNSACREVFEVREAPAEKVKPKAKPARDRKAPSFDDSPTEKVAADDVTAKAAAGPKAADWSAMPPPPVRRRDEPAAEPVAAPVGNGPAQPDEVLAWMMSAPAAPVTEASDEIYGDPTPPPPDEPDAPSYDALTEFHAPPRRSWAKWAVLFLFLVAAVGVGGGLWYYKSRLAKREVSVAGEATTAVEGRQWQLAGRKYDDLIKNFPKSKDILKYRFMKEYVEAQDGAYGLGPPDKRREEFAKYLQRTRDDDKYRPMLEERGREIYDALKQIASDQVKVAEKLTHETKFAEADAALTELSNVQRLIERNALPTEPPMPADLKARVDEVVKLVGQSKRRHQYLEQVRKLLEKPTPETIGPAVKLVKDGGYESDPEFITLILTAKDELKKQITFKYDPKPAEKPPAGGELTSLLVGGTAGAGAPTDKVVFALARGVLFALAEADGRILWATRVGIDAHTLPLRVPALGQRVPETVLIPTADGLGLLAREALTGKPRWFQRLPAPARGKPLLVDRTTVFVPLTDDEGRVVVLSSETGNQIGSIPLGRRLGPGGVVQEGASRAFIPADADSLFVLDTNPPADPNGNPMPVALQSIVVTGHGAGSLRSEPVIVGQTDEAGNGTTALVLPVSDGLTAMKLRAFPLLVQGQTLTLGDPRDTEPVMGWSWFAPMSDNEHLAVVTDNGSWALFGVNQKGNADDPLYPIDVSARSEVRNLSRGQVVHMEERAFWFLANGELNMRPLGFFRNDGQRLAPPAWKGVKLGAPLHAPQASADRETLFVVTQTASPPAWMATAIETHTGNVKWQRPLGLAPLGDPLKLGELVYQLDQGGGLYQIDPKQVAVPQGAEWVMGGQSVLPSRNDVAAPPVMLKAADGNSAYVVFTTGDGKQLLVRHVVPGRPVKEFPAATLPAGVAGTPLLAGNALVLPLVNGTLFRIGIGAKDGEVGPDWRGSGLTDSARAFVVALGEDLLATDGARGLKVFHWPAGQQYQLKQEAKVNSRIVAAPLVVPTKDAPPRVLVAEADGRVTALEGDALTQGLKWELRTRLRKGNEITAGPFLMEGGDPANPQVLLVMDQSRLVCLTLDSQEPAWTYEAKGKGLAGTPRRRGDALIVTDLSGRYEAIEAASGAAIGSGFPVVGVLPSAPAAAPVDFGPGRMFAPLADGTVLLLPLEALVPK
ncbi:MAG: PQQ-binding-like beta-propeller repeat protein [Gemmataceae bacterium]